MPRTISTFLNLRVRYTMIFSFLIMYVLATYIAVEYYIFTKSKTIFSRGTPVKLEYVVVHLDFKGAPPKLSYLESILPMLKNHGVNGLLLEYEDMFPYEGKLKSLRAFNYYSKKELLTYLTAAVSSGFEIIPLVQTFGHLEFALKLPEFAFLREDPQYIDSICPNKLKSQTFIREMLEQQIHFHQSIAPLKHIHVGCDEVYHFNRCTRCQKRNLTFAKALTSHINFVVNTVHTISPNTKVLIWDDMYRQVKPKHCHDLKFPNTEAVYWDYTPDPRENIHIDMYKYSRMFDNIWVASAFKGADGANRIIPDLQERFYNHLHWLNFILDYSTRNNLYKIKGIILTGWSRYKHLRPLCELFPASIPSLILNLILIEKYTKGFVVEDMNVVGEFIDNHIRDSLRSSLQCQKDLKGLPYQFDAETCNYEESDLYVVLEHLANRTSVINYIVEENAHKYRTPKESKYLYPHAEYVYFDDHQVFVEVCSVVIHELSVIETQLIGILSAYFENDVIREYIRTKIRHLVQVIEALFEFWNYKSLLNQKTMAALQTLNTSVQIRKSTKIIQISSTKSGS